MKDKPAPGPKLPPYGMAPSRSVNRYSPFTVSSGVAMYSAPLSKMCRRDSVSKVRAFWLNIVGNTVDGDEDDGGDAWMAD